MYRNYRETMDSDTIKLPLELEETCLAKFDDLVLREEIFYSVSTPEVVDYQGFKVRLTDAPSQDQENESDLQITVRVSYQSCVVG